MEITITPKGIYYPGSSGSSQYNKSTGNFQGGSPPEPEDAELTGIKVFIDGEEQKEAPLEFYQYCLDNFGEQLKEEAIEEGRDGELEA